MTAGVVVTGVADTRVGPAVVRRRQVKLPEIRFTRSGRRGRPVRSGLRRLTQLVGELGGLRPVLRVGDDLLGLADHLLAGGLLMNAMTAVTEPNFLSRLMRAPFASPWILVIDGG